MIAVKRWADKLSRPFVERMAKQPVPWGPLGYVTYKRCVDVDTPVLCDDLVWRKAGELQVGQGLVGFDEEYVKSGKGKWRYIRSGEVTHNVIEEAETMGIELEDGTILYATPDHSWLVKMAGNRCVWRETKDLETNSKGGDIYMMRPFGKVWETDTSHSGGYLAAAYDGEGNLDRLNGAAFVQVQNGMMERVEKYLTERGFTYDKKLRQSIEGRQKVYGLRIWGVKNLFRLLGQLQPSRIMTKFHEHLKSGKKLPALRCDPEDLVKVVRVFPAGVRKIAVMSTSTKTHFTGGFASHNTYSRLREDLGRTEEYHETVERCVNAILEYGGRFTKEEAETLYQYVYQLKCSPPGRMFWQLGTPTVARIGGNSLCNCFYVNVSDLESFCFTFDMLMLGGGVGFGVSPSDVFTLPKVLGPVRVTRRDGSDVDFIVPDNREGWVELLRRVLHAYFITGRSFTYSTHCVRGKGERIKGFGGVASGPGELVKGMGQICTVLDGRVGKKIRPVDALDIMNIIGSVVVSGNVRRSAQIAVGCPKDSDYLQAKMWSRGSIPNWRGNSNNTVRADDVSELTEGFWDGYKVDASGNAIGENYGLFNLALSRSHGRLADGCGYRPDPKVDGPNPCAEQSLEDGECCDLAEQYLPRLADREEFVTSSRMMYKVCKTVLQLPFAWAKTQEVVRRNQRMGVGVSGFCQAPHFDKDDFTAAYRAMEGLDVEYSREIKAERSVKLTTVKPSGTVSLLPGVTPGVHPGFSRHYIRRIRFSVDDPIVAACRKNGYHVEPKVEFDGTPDHGTQIVSFPVDGGADTITASQVSAVKQMDMQRFLQTHWSDNAVSVTVYYRDDELPEIKAKLTDEYRDGVKTISFTKHDKHGYKQAPYEEITAGQYADMVAKVKPVTRLDDAQQWDIVDSLECAGGACPTR